VNLFSLDPRAAVPDTNFTFLRRLKRRVWPPDSVEDRDVWVLRARLRVRFNVCSRTCTPADHVRRLDLLSSYGI